MFFKPEGSCKITASHEPEASWRVGHPDPSFYSSPGEATAAAPEHVAYVATLNTGTNGDRRPDAIVVLDVEEGSSTYGMVVGRIDMPNVGDELHHFG